MKDSIISPLWFYLIDVLGHLRVLLVFFVIILIFIAIGLFIFVILLTDDCYDDDTKELRQMCLNYAKKSIVALLISSTLCCLMPSKETMYTMLVAKYVTYENVEAAADIIQDSVDYIMDKLDEE